MNAVIQRVASARLWAEGRLVNEIGQGLCVYLGVRAGDGEEEAAALAGKIAALRVFEDEAGKLNFSALSLGLEVLVVSNFTLCADCRHGNRPSFSQAERPERAEALYERFCAVLTAAGVEVKRGVFGADMRIEQVNDGPVTIVLSAEGQGRRE